MNKINEKGFNKISNEIESIADYGDTSWYFRIEVGEKILYAWSISAINWSAPPALGFDDSSFQIDNRKSINKIYKKLMIWYNHADLKDAIKTLKTAIGLISYD